MIGERFNFEDVFFRDLTVCVLDTLEGEVKWVNKFSSGDRVVNVPFYYSMTGDERFLLDSFTDDIVSNSRYVDLNTDIIPRGHLTLTSYEIRADEFANPNVWLKMVHEDSTEIRKYLTKLRAIPITVRYDLVIHLSSEIDTFKCSQSILDTLWLYRFMYFEHNFMNIDAVMTIPDSSNIEINREKSLTSDNTIKLTVAFDVQTYYPAFRKPVQPDFYSYYFDTPYSNKNIDIKIELVQTNVSDGIQYEESLGGSLMMREFHNYTTSSSGRCFIKIGAGSTISGSYLGLSLKDSGLRLCVYIDSEKSGRFDLLKSEQFETAFPKIEVDKNLAWSNSFTNPQPDGDFRDIILYPKRTRWYNNLIELKGPNNSGGRNSDSQII